MDRFIEHVLRLIKKKRYKHCKTVVNVVKDIKFVKVLFANNLLLNSNQFRHLLISYHYNCSYLALLFIFIVTIKIVIILKRIERKQYLCIFSIL